MTRAITLALCLAVPSAALADAGKVSFLDGKAYRQANGQGDKIPLANGAVIQEKDLLSTDAKSRLEVTLGDQSVLRVGPSSSTVIDAAEFNDDGRKFSAKLVLGNVWAKVSSALGSDNKFEVTTERAVAGVRGTTFRVDSRKDKAVVVKVFAGAVAVAGNSIPRPEGASGETKPGGKPGRTQVAGPHQVTKKEWEKLVAAQMQIKVAADGSPGEPEKFAEADECKDAWTRWNRERDGDPCAE